MIGSEIVLETKDLTKRFNKKLVAVDHMNLSIPKGQVFGLLGPNGSGKSTTLGMILGVIAKTSGSFSWFGQGEGDHLRKRVGAILEQPNFYPNMSAVQNLSIHAKIKELKNPDMDGVLKMVNLYERRFDPFRAYSLGMKQRLAIASALLGDPEVLIFDEPTNGLDPLGIADIRNLLIEIRKLDKTIILASHLLDEVQKVCDHFAILRFGKQIYSGSVAEALQMKASVAVGSFDRLKLEEGLRSCSGISGFSDKGNFFLADLREGWNSALLNSHLVNSGIEVSYLEQKRSSLEETFLEVLQNQSLDSKQPSK